MIVPVWTSTSREHIHAHLLKKLHVSVASRVNNQGILNKLSVELLIQISPGFA